MDADQNTSPLPDEAVRAIVETPLVVQWQGMELAEARLDIPYTDDAQGPRLDVYLPPSQDAGLRPVVLFVHGGPLPAEGYPEAILRPKDWRFYQDYGRLAAARGMIGVSFDHRYRSTADFARSVDDLRAVAAWVRGHAAELEADPERVGVWVFSGAGAHLGWLLADPPSGVRAVAAFYPVLSFDAFESLGMPPTPDEIATQWDPAAGLGPDAPPLLVARAGQDSAAINESIDAFTTTAIARGATLDLLLHPTGVHGFDVRNDVPRSHEVVERTFAFFDDAFTETWR